MRVFGAGLNMCGGYAPLGEGVVEAVVRDGDLIKIDVEDTGGGDGLHIEIETPKVKAEDFVLNGLRACIGRAVEVENDMVYLVNDEVEKKKNE